LPALGELQAEFRAALLGGDAHAAVQAVRSDGLPAAARLAIYRHHVVTTLTAALESTYPVVARLVDARFFRYAADRYIREEPPAGPCLFEYGATFADFLARFRAARSLAYLPDVARLEWAMNVALHAREAVPIEPDALRLLPAVALHPSVTLLSSPWPVDAIWRTNQPDADDGRVDLDGGGVHLQVWRDGDDVVLRALSIAEHAFRATLAARGCLATAASAAVAVDRDVDLAALVRRVLEEQVLTAA
jgi:hypothetical protein